ncbi:MAG: ABC transporter permease subunit [Candidatus Eisenbacteria bacterium]|nr:ABC transporter permease subunit [Candidatus Latescibacterota bacterium]MBD3302310.1 ABC transporter permease subunit [Candidatus Eisenbacteria bacterium]
MFAAAIAWNTFLEAVREKVLYLLAAFAGFVFLGSRIFAPLALGEGRRVTIDLGMMGLSVAGLLVVVFVGHSLVYRELERGTVAFLFSRPVGRGSFVLGKFLGLAGVLAVLVAAMATILAAVLFASGYPIGPELLASSAIALLELWILAALAILLASLASPITAGLFVVAAWVIGNAAGALGDLAALFPSDFARTAAGALLWVLPRLDLYDAAYGLVHAVGYSTDRWIWTIAYAGVYIGSCLLLARAAFARRPLFG